MKIAFIRKSFTPYGGAENYLNSLISHLKAPDNDIHVLSTSWTSTETGVNIHKIDTVSFNSLTSTLSFNRNATRTAKMLSCDCTVSFERTTWQDIYRAGDGCHKQWLILRGQDKGKLKRLSFALNPMHRAILSIERECFSATPLIIANSNMVKSHIMEHYSISADKIAVLYNGVDLERFKPINRSLWERWVRNEYVIPADCPILLFVGSGFERKGLKTAISALAQLNGQFRLIIAGAGGTSRYKTLARDLGVTDMVIFAGPQTYVERLYAASDVFVLPTLYDPFSNATLEALASGIPVVTTKNNGAAEIIQHGKDGLILENTNDASELADKITQIIENRESYALNAAQKALAYPISGAALDFLNLIRAYTKTRD
ncbi:MAG: glycosyltransferase family 4 protein [Nitrospirae bacterium]|nr:glycosyltransferase family 4 protein [Nitrospirota bacterium]